ncbi:glucose-6-phosphate isomerase [Candidatus Pacearchaeota archaeon]|nr:glucose-6-phosphate isomerase [Candidatus Pacearchaeota archaeon]
MIEIDIQNALSEKIGIRHGVSKRVFNRFLEKSSPHIKTVFQSKNKMGYDFLNLPNDQKLIRKIKTFIKTQEKNKWENIVVLGIGGSALGGIALKDALLGSYHYLDKAPHLFFVDNIDPDLINELLSRIPLEKSLFIVISKSGGTTEPMALYSLFKERLIQRKVKKINKHFVFITDPKGGLLRPLGKREGIEMFDVPPKVGGRFSVLSSVGLVPTALAGIDISALMRGAKKMKAIIQKSSPEKNPALILASLQYLLDRKKGKEMTVMMPYSNPLFRVGDWYRQLLAESIGKNKSTGPTPINALGTTDQHSQLQLFNEGPNNKWFIFLNVLKYDSSLSIGNHLPKKIDFLNNKNLSEIINAAYTGTAESLSKNKRPNITLNISRVNAEVMGALFMLLEFQVALLGLMYKVDAFNQPGVEISKIITKQILSK